MTSIANFFTVSSGNCCQEAYLLVLVEKRVYIATRTKFKYLPQVVPSLEVIVKSDDVWMRF